MRKALQTSKVRTDEQGKLKTDAAKNDSAKGNQKNGVGHTTIAAQSGRMLPVVDGKSNESTGAVVDKSTFAEMRGNPIYSPDDSLAKAATKLATLRSTSSNPQAAENSGSITNSTFTLTAPTVEATPTATAHTKSHAPHLVKANATKQVATPGSAWRPQGKSGNEEVPLAARTLLSKRNRRKSVYQRPARYGDWFDGDDEELEKMVHDFNGDEQQEGNASKNAKSRNSKHDQPSAADPVANPNSNVVTKSDQHQHKERAARRKSAFPTVGRSPGNFSAPSGSPPSSGNDGNNKLYKQPTNSNSDSSNVTTTTLTPISRPIKKVDSAGRLDNSSKPPPGTPQNRTVNTAQKIRALAAGLCNQLDGLIEESPAVPRGFSRFENKSLRDKLVESWQGRSYYERLMQMAGTGVPQTEEGQTKMIAAAAEAGKRSENPVGCQDAEKEDAEHANVGSTTQEGGPSVGILGFLSPPKPRRKVVDVHPSSRVPYAVSTQSPEPASRIFIAGQDDDVQQEEKVSIQEDKEEAFNRNTAVEDSVESLTAKIEDLQIRLNDALEEAKTEEAARKAAEKRIEVLEAELEKSKQKDDVLPRKTVVSCMQKLSDKAAEMEGRWGLVEAQLEVISNAVKLLDGHVSSGRAEAQSVIDSLLNTFAPPPSSSSDGVDQAGQAARRSRARRKSTWRG